MIFLLDEDPIKNAQCLDDIALDKQIREIAQTLCNVHWFLEPDPFQKVRDKYHIPSGSHTDFNLPWNQWARNCHANYMQLVDMGLACCEEYKHRFSDVEKKFVSQTNSYVLTGTWKKHKLQPVIAWARDHIPELPDNYKKDIVIVEINGIKQKVLSPTLKQEMTYFPINIPAKYWVVDDPFPVCDLVASHRKYYQAKLKKGLKRKIKCPACWDEPEHLLFAGIKAKCPGYIEKPITPTFTRREKPEWLNLED